MSRGAVVAPEVTDGTGLARARQRFLAAQPVEPGQVRDTILASWQRSRRWNVAAGHIDPCYVRDPGRWPAARPRWACRVSSWVPWRLGRCWPA
jgi:hypothetical protein